MASLSRSNLDLQKLQSISRTALEIRVWLGDRGHPERYKSANSPELVRDFVHTLDLLETTLTRFEIASALARIALEDLSNVDDRQSLSWEFWQIDVEEFIAATVLEFCYQLSNAWESLDQFARKDSSFAMLTGRYRKPSQTLIARHHATHFQPDHFQRHRIASDFSILRRPYLVKDGVLSKELAKETMPKVASLIKAALVEGERYLLAFREVTIGEGVTEKVAANAQAESK